METQHHLAAVWFADIVGYSRMAAEDEERALRVVRAFQEATREVVRRHDGRVVKYIGDAALASFQSADAAVRAACRLAFFFAERAGADAPALRIAVHAGEVAQTEDGDVYGDGVNLAARAVREAAPGEVWVTGDVWRQLRQRPRFRFEPRGTRELRGVGSVELWSVVGVQEEAEPAEGLRAHGRALVRGIDRHRVAAAFSLAAVAALVGWLVLPDLTTRSRSADADDTTAALDPAMVAVLYFEDASPGRELGYLADGLTEALIHDLAQVDELGVVSREGVRPFREAATPLDSIARALGAGTLIEGRVAESGDRVRVTAQLVDGTTLTNLESIEVERPRGELFDLLDDLAEEVSVRLRQHLGQEIRLEKSRRETSVVEAWQLVQQAERLTQQAKLTDKEDPEVAASLRTQADQLLARAETLDPRWTEPTVARAEVAAWMGEAPAYEVGLAHAERALAKEPGNAHALAVRGALHDSLASVAGDSVTAARHLGLAQRDLRTAVSVDPRLATAWIGLADLLYNDLYQLSEARSAAERAYQADPFLLEEDHFAWLCEISFQLQDYPEAERWCGEGRRRFPSRTRLMMVELSVLASDGVEPDVEKAWRLVNEIGRQEFPEFNVPVARMIAASVLARAGQPDSAKAVVAQARRTAPDEVAPFLDFFDARLRLVLDDRPGALRHLRSFVTLMPSYRAQLAQDHWFRDLAGPSFEALVDRRRQPIFCRLLCEAP
jgi:class 3 adenylate cyclase/TolB-like protein